MSGVVEIRVYLQVGLDVFSIETDSTFRSPFSIFGISGNRKPEFISLRLPKRFLPDLFDSQMRFRESSSFSDADRQGPQEPAI